MRYLTTILLLVPSLALAASPPAGVLMQLKADRMGARVGDEFTLTLTLNTQNEEVNAVAGTVVLPPELAVSEVKTNQSIVTFWVEAPTLVDPAHVKFSGLVPGGYAGQGEILSLAVTAQAAGQADSSLSDVQILRNDGQGTPLAVELKKNVPLTITAASQSTPTQVVESAPDTVPPEPFVPVVGREQSVFGGRWFVAFVTRDAGSGIAQYQVLETKNPAEVNVAHAAWQAALSPYPLTDQRRQSFIFVRARDKAGNTWTAEVMPQTQAASWYEKSGFWFMIIGVAAVALAVWWIKFKRAPGRPSPDIKANAA